MFKTFLVTLSILFASVSSLHAANFSISEDKSTLFLTGEIETNDVEKIDELWNKYKFKTLNLSSLGGSFYPGVVISLFILEKQIDTEVSKGQQCNSSCAYIWMSGKTKSLSRYSSIGFHLPYYNQKDLDKYNKPELELAKKILLFEHYTLYGTVAWLIGLNTFSIDMYLDLLKLKLENENNNDAIIYLDGEKSKSWLIPINLTD